MGWYAWWRKLMEVFIALCVVLALYGLLWFVLGRPDPTDRNGPGGWTPWG